MLLLDLFLVGIGAVAGGWACRRLGVPEVLGYLAAGIVLGPAMHPGRTFVDPETIAAIAAFAVLFRMFALGLDFDPKRLSGRWTPALSAGLLGMTLCTLGGLLLSRLMGWGLLEGAVLGAALGTTSTTILSKALADRDMSTREDARAAGAATLAEDLIAMSVIALLAVFAGAGDVGTVLERALGLVVFATLAFTAGAVLVPIALDRLGRSKSDELLTLAVIGMLFGFAALSFGLGAGVALGAFLAGVAVGAARHAPGVSARVLPLRDLLAATAYVALGLFLEPAIILRVAPYAVPLSLAFVALKGIAVTLGLRMGGVSTPTAARAGAILGQAGTMGLVFICHTFLDPADFPELLAFAFVSWAFTVALTPLRLRYGPDLAERLARLVGARERRARGAAFARHMDADEGAALVAALRAAGCAAALGALLGLLGRGLVGLPPAAAISVALVGGALAGAAILPFALASATAARLAARHRVHEAALRPSWLSRGRQDPARPMGHATTLFVLAASLLAPLGLAGALSPGGPRAFLLAGALAGALALLARPTLVARLHADAERLARAPSAAKGDARVHDFRGVSAGGFEVEAVHVRAGTAAAWATLRDLRIPERTGARVVAILRAGSRDSVALGPDARVHPGDDVVLGGSPASVVAARGVLHEARADSGPLVHDAARDDGGIHPKGLDGRAPRIGG